MRPLSKAEKSLPRSPGKRNAVVSSLSKSFNCICYLSIHKLIEDEQDLDADEKSWLIDCLDRQDFTHITPGKRDQAYIGKINGKKVYETKKYLLWTLNDFLHILNGCEVTGIQTEDSFMNEFGRKLSFRQLYELIKANKQYIYNKNIPHATCLCQFWFYWKTLVWLQ